MPKFPAFFLDIDGLLLRGSTPIPRVLETLHYLRNPISFLYNNSSFPSISLPLVLLTNGGAALPPYKINRYNKIFGLEKEKKLEDRNIILNYSPLKEEFGVNKKGLWLITGMGLIKDIAKYCGFYHTITVKEYEKYPNKSEIQGVLILDDVIDWEQNLKVLLELLKNKGNDLDIVSVHADRFYPDEFPLPRMCLGVFLMVLEKFAQKILGKQPNVLLFGKPSLRTFEFAKVFAQKQWPEIEISQFYMLGDNPETDILGGNRSKMQTVLVKTGVYNDGNKEILQDYERKPTYIVQDFFEAIHLIAEKEGFSLKSLKF